MLSYKRKTNVFACIKMCFIHDFQSKCNWHVVPSINQHFVMSRFISSPSERSFDVMNSDCKWQVQRSQCCSLLCARVVGFKGTWRRNAPIKSHIKRSGTSMISCHSLTPIGQHNETQDRRRAHSVRLNLSPKARVSFKSNALLLTLLLLRT